MQRTMITNFKSKSNVAWFFNTTSISGWPLHYFLSEIWYNNLKSNVCVALPKTGNAKATQRKTMLCFLDWFLLKPCWRMFVARGWEDRLKYRALIDRSNRCVCKKGIEMCTYRVLWYSMCSLAVSTLDSPAVVPRSNSGSGKILISENLRLYTTSPVVMC